MSKIIHDKPSLKQTLKVLAALLNVTFGNTVELIISIIALSKGQIRIVQVSVLGSIFSNILLVLGSCFLASRITILKEGRLKQEFSSTAAQANSSIMTLACIALVVPAAFILAIDGNSNSTISNSAPNAIDSRILHLSYRTSILKTHKDLFNNKENEEPQISKNMALFLLIIVTVIIGFSAEFLVSSIEGVDLSKTFIGLILLPIIGNAAEHTTSVTVAMKNKMDFAICVIVGSSTQIALFVIPLLVILEWIIGQPMSLNFEVFETICLLILVLLLNYLVQIIDFDRAYKSVRMLRMIIVAGSNDKIVYKDDVLFIKFIIDDYTLSLRKANPDKDIFTLIIIIIDTQEKNLLYEALSWIISQQTKELDKGSFIVQPTNSKNYGSYEVPDFNILPEKKQQIIIEYKDHKFNVVYKLQETDKNNNNPQPLLYYKTLLDPMPSIYLSIINNGSSLNTRLDVNAITEFIYEVTHSYFKAKEKHYRRSRYKRKEGNWIRVQYLSDLNGLETVVLDEPLEILLKKELDSFVNDKEFYKRNGIPYRCGFLLYGKPGTRKTSLIYAISSYLSRDLYYLNLNKIKNDNDMSAVFSSVPLNQIIVLEDVDTQSNILYKRDNQQNYFNFISEDFLKEKDDLSKYKKLFSFISLSNFLRCLDGQILLEGTIIIMTTNHIEHLDPTWNEIKEIIKDNPNIDTRQISKTAENKWKKP
ncbi:26918_t:CDS:2 [Gigaspora margarita]|uniref:26918_t:CDS:1 n=1 Tax=Gigaspora margarita TaxID=4874 RepID=A0ABN7UGV8_GIGMA|nr:26918_t:CDS:2 [Gigaspora margarita]